jgi:hypothetical protein
MLQKLNYDNSTGKYWMEMTEEELALVAGLMALTRLGMGNPYSDAAYNLTTGIEQLKGSDYSCDSIDTAGLAFSITGNDGSPVAAVPAVNMTIETGI